MSNAGEMVTACADYWTLCLWDVLLLVGSCDERPWWDTGFRPSLRELERFRDLLRGQARSWLAADFLPRFNFDYHPDEYTERCWHEATGQPFPIGSRKLSLVVRCRAEPFCVVARSGRGAPYAAVWQAEDAASARSW